MANSRIYLTCRHCGAQMFMGKGYYGEYHLGDYHGDWMDRMNDFYDNHGSNCDGNTEWDMTDNARAHYIILEEGETWNPKTNSIDFILVWDKNSKKCIHHSVKLPDEYDIY